jgi:hypothetical protein
MDGKGLVEHGRKFLAELLGRVVQLPIPLGEKGPKFKGWKDVTFQDTQTPDYQLGLFAAEQRGGNIGVKCGPDSERLIVADIDVTELVELFVNRFPFMTETTVSRAKRGAKYWFRLADGCDFPAVGVVTLKGPKGEKIGELRLGGGGKGVQVVALGRHPEGMEYVFDQQIPPLVISLAHLYALADGKLEEQAPPQPAVEPARVELPGEVLGSIAGFFNQSCAAALEHRGSGGHNTLLAVTGEFLDNFVLSDEQAVACLARYYNHRCVPPWSEKDLMYKVIEARKLGHGKRRENPPNPPSAELHSARANPPNPPNPPPAQYFAVAGEDLVEMEDFLPGNLSSSAELSQEAIFPSDSIFATYFNLVREITEGADCYVIGSILPVGAALLSRAVSLPWCGKNLCPNLFAIVVGKPGDRKSSTIDLAEIIARKALPPEAFIPLGFSPETLFDEYDKNSGGRPDKLWIMDDANPVLADWKSEVNGERNAARFLRLYDCKDLSESYRRNREKNNPTTQRRVVPQTSTSVLFGSTFSLCMFHKQAVRAGLQRRFLYYVAQTLGREILYPRSAIRNW